MRRIIKRWWQWWYSECKTFRFPFPHLLCLPQLDAGPLPSNRDARLITSDPVEGRDAVSSALGEVGGQVRRRCGPVHDSVRRDGYGTLKGF